MHETDFAFAVGRVRVLETRLLDAGRFERMLDARDADEVFRILGETEYASAMANMKNPGEFEEALASERRRAFSLVRQLMAPDREIGDLYFFRFDVHDLKVMLKAQMTGQPAEGLTGDGVYGLDAWKGFLSGEQTAPSPLSEWISAGRSALATGDPGAIDLALDAAYFSFAAEVSRRKGWAVMADYWTAALDLTNVVSMVRCRRLGAGIEGFGRYFIAGGRLNLTEMQSYFDQPDDAFGRWLDRSGYGALIGGQAGLPSLAGLERGVREYLSRLLIAASRVSVFGPEPVFAYLLAKESELQNVRIVIVGKLNGVPREAVRERLNHAHL